MDRDIDKYVSTISLIVSITYLFSFIFQELSPLFEISRSLLGLIILTYLLGSSVRIFIKYVPKISKLPPTFSIGGLASDILFSFIINLIINAILIKFFIFYEYIQILLIIILNGGLNIITVLTLSREPAHISLESQVRDKVTFYSLLSFIILLIASTLFAIVFRSTTPLPTINGWDMNPSLAYINWIISHHGYRYLLIPPFPRGLIPYPSLFFYLVSSYSLFLDVNPLLIYWYSVFIIIFSYIVLIFLVAFKISKNHSLSLTSAFIAFFISTANAESVRNPLYLTLDMIGQLIFLLILVFNIYHSNNGIGKKIMNLFAIIFLILYNYLTAIAVFPFLLWILIGKKTLPLIGDGRKVFRFTSIVMGLSVPILISVSSYMSSNLKSFFTSPTIPYLDIITIQNIYPPYFWVIFSIALFSVVIHQIREPKKISIYSDILIYICCSFSIYFNPAQITRRIEFYTRIFLSIFISGLVYLIDTAKWNLRLELLKKKSLVKIKLGSVLSIFLLLITIIMMYPLFNYYTFDYPYKASITKDEYEATEWIKNNTPTRAYILTDPSSGFVFRGYVIRNASTSFILPDGRMPRISSSIYPNLKEKLHEFFLSQSLEESVRILKTLPFNQTYIVVTSRTVLWGLYPWALDSIFASPPLGVNYSNFINKFQEPYFKNVYDSKTVKIYKPSPSLAIKNITIWKDNNFINGWNYYLGGSYGEHSYETNFDVLTLTVQARDTKNAYMGLRKKLNCSGATYLEIKSKMNLTPYHLEIKLTDENNTLINTYRSSQSSTWLINRFILTESEARKVREIILIIWTKDTYTYTLDIDYLLFGYIRVES